MKRLNLLLIGAALALPTLSQAALNIGVEGSVHDMSTNSTYTVWNTRNGVCSPCHVAHNSDPAQLIPLWAHQTSVGGASGFTMYSSPTLKATMPAAPTSVSLACLSCHDGTLGLNASIGSSPTNTQYYIPASFQVGPDLHANHPISFAYNSALAVADPGVQDPMVYTIGSPKTNLTVSVAPVPASWSGSSLTGQTINQALLWNGYMQCSSCHDPHSMIGSAPSSGILLKISGTDATGRGDLICRTCHIK
jgi:hypothetical protein